MEGMWAEPVLALEFCIPQLSKRENALRLDELEVLLRSWVEMRNGSSVLFTVLEVEVFAAEGAPDHQITRSPRQLKFSRFGAPNHQVTSQVQQVQPTCLLS